MNRILDETLYEVSHPIRIAYREGKLDMLEDVKEIAATLLANAKINPFKTTSDFERGQIAALTAIIESCSSFAEHLEAQDSVDVKFDA